MGWIDATKSCQRQVYGVLLLLERERESTYCVVLCVFNLYTKCTQQSYSYTQGEVQSFQLSLRRGTAGGLLPGLRPPLAELEEEEAKVAQEALELVVASEKTDDVSFHARDDAGA